MRIERVLPGDAEALLEIYAPYVEETAISFEYTVPTVSEFRRRIAEISAQFPYIKAVDGDGTILGYAYAGTFKARQAYDWNVETTVYGAAAVHGAGAEPERHGHLQSQCLHRLRPHAGRASGQQQYALSCANGLQIGGDVS